MPPAKGYTEMKDSGIEWLGKIPNNWRTIRVKYAFRIKKEIAGELGHTVLSVTQRGIKPKDMSEKGQFSLDYSKYQLVSSGDFIMNHMDLLTGWVDISNMDGVTSPDYRVFQSSNPEKYYPDFYRYVFQTCYQQRIFYGLGQGVSGFGRWRLPAEIFLNFYLPVPPYESQSAIAAYLDTHCAKIDEIIAQAKASIEDYKQWKASIIYEAVTKGLNPNVEMKDSGVEWIGKVPKEWKAIPLKVCTSKIGSGKTPQGGAETYQDNGVLFLRSQNVYNTGLELDGVYYISDEIDSTMKNSRVRYNDVLLNITGGSIGRCCLFDLPDTAANVNQHVCIIRTKPEILLPQFLRYFWNSAAGPMVIDQYQTGSNRQGLNFEQIGATHIPLCSIAEQRQIVAMLDQKCAVIDQLMAEKQSLIDDLESYKKSLIYEVVTGKRYIR